MFFQGVIPSDPDPAYATSTPTAGQSVVMAAGIDTQILTPAGTIATATVTLPVNPLDGQIVRVCTTQIVTTLTVSPGTGATMGTTYAAALAAGGGLQWLYKSSNATWYKID